MTNDEFRKLALSMTGAEEKSHMNHPDFRVGGKIFASLAKPEAGLGMVKVSAAHQRILVLKDPSVYVPCAGAWGRQGCTYVHLAKAGEASVHNAILAAWRNTAPENAPKKRTQAARKP